MGERSQGGGVRVALCEAEPALHGSLRSILETEGFDVVGLVGTASDLTRLLPLADIDVLVLDAHAGAMAMLAAQACAPRVAIVVVWPAGVRAEGADQQVEPSRASTELGAAVRTAARRHQVVPGHPVIGADLLVLPDLGSEEPNVPPDLVTAAAAPLPGSTPRSLPTRTSVALIAASIFLAFAAAAALQAGIGSGVGALHPVLSPRPAGGPRVSRPKGNGGRDHPQVPKPTQVGPSPISPVSHVDAATVGETSRDAIGTGSAGTPTNPTVRHLAKRRHRIRHRRRHRKRQNDHGETDRSHTGHAGDASRGHHGHPAHHGHPGRPGRPGHGNRHHHGESHD